MRKLKNRFDKIGFLFTEKQRNAILKTFSTTQPHPLLHLLRGDYFSWRLQEDALEAIREYDEFRKTSFVTKARKKLHKAAGREQIRDITAEIMVVSYYFQKFMKSEDIDVEWERSVIGSDGRLGDVDVSIIGVDDEPINIEVKVLAIDQQTKILHEVQNVIEGTLIDAVCDSDNPQFVYGIDLVSNMNLATVSSMREEYLPALTDFVLECKKSGCGEYHFDLDGYPGAELRIEPLNNLKKEDIYVLCPCCLNDNIRIKGKIRDAAAAQLPKKERNFVCIANFAGADCIDLLEGVLGQEQYGLKYQRRGPVTFWRKPNGAFSDINRRDISPILGVVVFTLDYTSKRIILNSSLKVEQCIIDVVD